MRALLPLLAAMVVSQNVFAFSQEEACAEYNIGESHSFSVYESLKAPIFYSVLRQSQSEYAIYVNIDFLGNQAIRKKVASCLEVANKVGLTSAPTQITMHLYEEGMQNIAVPRKQLIQVHDHTERADSLNFALDLPCSTIVHELFHSAGLSDEYRERANYVWFLGIKRSKDGVDKPAYDCRSQSDSLMSSSRLWDLTKPNLRSVEDKFCACPKTVSKDQCYQAITAYRQRVESVRQDACPDGMDLSTSNEPLPADSAYSFIVSLPSTSTRVYPLRNGHVRHVLWPHCKSKNKLYDLCVSNAYHTSTGNGGAGCFPVPEVCTKLNEWLE